jgi:hypothetical protein
VASKELSPARSALECAVTKGVVNVAFKRVGAYGVKRNPDDSENPGENPSAAGSILRYGGQNNAKTSDLGGNGSKSG